MPRPWQIVVLCAAAGGVGAVLLAPGFAERAAKPPLVFTVSQIPGRAPASWPDCPSIPNASRLNVPVSMALEMDVYRDALIGVALASRGGHAPVRVRILSTTPPRATSLGRAGPWGFSCRDMPELDLTALRSYRTANAETRPLRAWFMLPLPYRVVRGPVSAELVRNATPLDPVVGLSAIGFSDDLRQALLYVEQWKAFGYGEGYYVLMTPSGHAWKILRKVVAWMA